MNRILSIFKQFIAHLLAWIPTPLPIGMEEFDIWAKSVLSLTRLPDNDSTRFALASIVPHQKAERFYIPKRLFANMLCKSAANQVGGAVMHELKEKQQAAIAAEQAAIEAAKQAEATALVVSNEQGIGSP